jgi:hypothetical protein
MEWRNRFAVLANEINWWKPHFHLLNEVWLHSLMTSGGPSHHRSKSVLKLNRTTESVNELTGGNVTGTQNKKFRRTNGSSLHPNVRHPDSGYSRIQFGQQHRVWVHDEFVASYFGTLFYYW